MSDQGEKQKNNLDQEVREMISTLTDRLVGIRRTHKSHGQEEDDDGVGIITLAGTNVGATMHGTGDTTEQKPHPPQGLDHEDFTTYVNSNFQAVNNSILLGGSYTTNDPGVHLDISDYFERRATTRSKHGKKKIVPDKESSKSDSQSQNSDH